ncbi:transmembrane ascorbate ferrireductase 2 [Lactuca sativa]|uniref:transmembrane ascorbate ferrireductase 2 n=1 Tax=Lactuca sativa TaxID=4236 RepID=UPI000CC15B99|nr:transmembrane ascorbate ferrireductase 2 [Lactuca sativa]
MSYLSLLTHLLAISLASLVIYWLITFRNGFGLFNPSTDLMFNWHPLLMILGFIIFSAEAMIAYKAIRGTRQSLKRVHLTLHSIALVTGLCGVYAACKYHYQLQVPHLYTLHSWYGYSTIWLFCLQFMLGVDDFVYPGNESGIGRSHGLAGLLIFWLAILSAGTGLMKKSDILHLYPGQVETNVV